MRPKFTIANLLLLTVIVAMGAQMYRNRIHVQKLEAELALHEAVRAQTHRVRQRVLEFQATMHQSEPEVQMAALYRFVGSGDQSEADGGDSAVVRRVQLDIPPVPICNRRAAAQVRYAELQLIREQEKLYLLEHSLCERLEDQEGIEFLKAYRRRHAKP